MKYDLSFITTLLLLLLLSINVFLFKRNYFIKNYGAKFILLWDTKTIVRIFQIHKISV